MADIAAVFHWPPAVLDPMSLGELARWWARARARIPSLEEPDA